MIWTSSSKGGYLGLHGQRQLNLQDTLSSAYRHLKDSANDTKQTIPLTCSTRCNACSSAISMQAAVFVLIHCNEHISHLGPDQHNQPCLATIIEKADMAFGLYSNTLGNEFLETQLFNKSSIDSKWVWCRPTAIILLSFSPISEALKSNGLGFRWFQEPSNRLDPSRS